MNWDTLSEWEISLMDVSWMEFPERIKKEEEEKELSWEICTIPFHSLGPWWTRPRQKDKFLIFLLLLLSLPPSSSIPHFHGSHEAAFVPFLLWWGIKSSEIKDSKAVGENKSFIARSLLFQVFVAVRENQQSDGLMNASLSKEKKWITSPEFKTD